MSYQLITLNNQVTQLSWPYPAIPNLITVAEINNVMAADNGFQLQLPSANNVGTGTTILFNNVGQTDFILQDVNGKNIPQPNGIVVSGQVISIYLTDNSTTSGSWTVIPFGKGATAITNIKFTSPSNSIRINTIPYNPNNQISAPGGTVNMDVTAGLQELIGIGQVGIPVILEFAPLQWGTFAIQAGPSDNIIITNGTAIADNQAADPIIDLASTINLTALNVGNFQISGSSLTAASNTNLNFSTDEGNTITLNQVEIDSVGDIIIPNDLTVSGDLIVEGSINGPGTATAWVRFTDNGNNTNNITIIDSYNIALQTATTPGVVGTQGSYTITFATPFNDGNYAINIALIRGTETIAPLLAYPTSPINAQNMNIMTIDTLGNLLPVTDGVSVIIFGD